MGMPNRSLIFKDPNVLFAMEQQGISPVELLEQYISNTPNEAVRDISRHRETLDSIIDTTKLPSEEDVRDLLFYSAVISGTNLSQHQDLFGKRSIVGSWSDLGTGGGLTDDNIMQAWTRECITALGTDILALGVTDPIYEIGAGRGELSYHLNQLGISTIPTDKKPGSRLVQQKNVTEVLQYRPGLVIACWAEGGMVDEITGNRDVRYFIEISDNKHPWCGEPTRDNPDWSVTKLSQVQKHYIPLDLFCAARQTGDYNRNRELQYASALAQFRFDTASFLGKNDLMFLWTRK